MNQELMGKSERIEELEKKIEAQDKQIEDLEINQDDIIEELEEAHKLEIEEVQRFGEDQANVLRARISELETEIQRKKRSLLNAMEALGNQLYPEVKSPATRKPAVTYVSEEVMNHHTRRPSWNF